jgi:hypothetical protein
MPVPVAKDGSNTAACFDGSCEVLLRPGVKFAVKPGGVGVTRVTLHTISEGLAVLSARGSDGSGNAFSIRQGGQMQIERLAVDVKYLGKDRAIMHFYPKAADQ